LGFAARKRGGRLTQADIAQPNILESLQAALDLGKGIKKLIAVFDGHVKHFSNVLVFEAYLQVSWL
jgi:hypothetical protein